MAELLPLIGFVFVGLFSPGPNVIMLTASGARFGFRRTLPHIFGVVIGVAITSGLTGLGIGSVLAAQPLLETVLKIAASLWIMVMAYGVWHRAAPQMQDGARPFSLLAAALFQWVNPKVWAVAFSATAYVAALPPVNQGLTLAATFAGLNLLVCLFWASAGSVLAYLVTNPVVWRWFMRAMALALAGFSLMVFL